MTKSYFWKNNVGDWSVTWTWWNKENVGPLHFRSRDARTHVARTHAPTCKCNYI